MTPNADHEKIILCGIFRRKGGNGIYTKIYDELDLLAKELLQKQVQETDDEKLVIAGIINSSEWQLITTKKIIWGTHGVIKSINFEELIDALVDLPKLMKDNVRLVDNTELVVITKDGQRTILKLEAGKSFSGIWNIIKFIGLRNRRAEQKSS
ncbi:MAG: hypothetical protein IPP74_00905 [Alphaproteobacteria bacterium]|nr:hypothetical protein [Alphaproteobacteria bacterium]